MARFVAAIDQGTTSTRCILFNRQGEAVAIKQMEHQQIYPNPGWVEHDALEIWARTQDVVIGALIKADVTAVDIAAVGITNQRETTIVWNKKTGKPLCNAIVWQDTRTSKICKELAKEGGNNRFQTKVGLPLTTYFSGPKIRWILDNIDGAREAAENGDVIFGNMDSWIIWHLTGGINGGSHITDVSNASRTMLMDLNSCQWDTEITEIMGIPLSMLPEIRPSSDPNSYGYTLLDGPFGGRIPVCGDLGDQHAATVGQAGLAVGEAKNTYGTGCFMILNTGNDIIPSKNGLLTTVCYKFGDMPTVYALEGSIAIAGALVQWLRDNLNIIDNACDIETLAKTVDNNGGMYFVPAFSGLYAPYWRSDARGVIAGLTGYINRGHFARAVIEATAYQTREVVDAMRADSGVILKALKVDGGMVVNDLLMQFQSDVLNLPVVRPKVIETTALGAAYAAGLAVGFWENEDDIRDNWHVDKTWQPSEDDTARVANYNEWKKAVARTFDWVD